MQPQHKTTILKADQKSELFPPAEVNSIIEELKNGKLIKNIDKKYWPVKEIALAALEREGGRAFSTIRETELDLDSNFALAALDLEIEKEPDGKIYNHFSDTIKKNFDVSKKALQINGLLLEEVTDFWELDDKEYEGVNKYKELIKIAVKQNGLAIVFPFRIVLRDYPEEYFTEEMLKIAFSQNGLALIEAIDYVPNLITGNLFGIAIEQDPSTWESSLIKPFLKTKKPDFLIPLLVKVPAAFNDLSFFGLQNNREFVMEVLKNTNRIFEYIPELFKQDLRLVYRAIMTDKSILNSKSEAVRPYILEFLKNNAYLFGKEIKNIFKSDDSLGMLKEFLKDIESGQYRSFREYCKSKNIHELIMSSFLQYSYNIKEEINFPILQEKLIELEFISGLKGEPSNFKFVDGFFDANNNDMTTIEKPEVESIIEALKNGKLIKNIDKKYWSVKEIALAALEQEGVSAFTAIRQTELDLDSDFALAALDLKIKNEPNGEIYYYFNEVQQNYEVSKKAFEKKVLDLNHAVDHVPNLVTLDFIKALKQNRLNWKSSSDKKLFLKTKKPDFLIPFLVIVPEAFNDLSLFGLQNNRKFVMEVLKNTNRIFEYIPKPFKDDPKLVYQAIMTDKSILNSKSEKVRPYILEFVKNNAYLFGKDIKNTFKSKDSLGMLKEILKDIESNQYKSFEEFCKSKNIHELIMGSFLQYFYNIKEEINFPVLQEKLAELELISGLKDEHSNAKFINSFWGHKNFDKDSSINASTNDEEPKKRPQNKQQ